MFIRFVTTRWDARARTHYGFFAPAYWARDNVRVPAWQRAELARELAWFDRYLAAPGVLRVPTGHKQARNGVCWFHDGAAEHVSHARYVVWLLREIGVPVAELRARDPGTLIWRDAHQVVALADRRVAPRIH